VTTPISPKSTEAMKSQLKTCWCGGARLSTFNAEYVRCEACQTLICACPPNPGDPRMRDDESALYGKDYWLKHQQQAYGLGDIYQRSRTDLSERNLFWLNQLLKIKLPPGNALEIGCAHGGFTHLMQQSGFAATGLELSPSIVGFAQRTFDIPVFCGPVEEQPLLKQSFDVIALMDVLEHLPNPLKTIRHCVGLLKPDGVLFIQTPRYPSPKSFAEMAATQHKFLAHLNPLEHTFLFSVDGVRKLMQAAGAGYVESYSAIFGFYDQFFAASPSPIRPMAVGLRDEWLSQTSGRRVMRALLDSEDKFRAMLGKYRELKRNQNEETLYAAA